MAVDVIEDGDAAVSLAQNAPYDVIVLDVMLPHRDGFQVSRTLRSRRVQAPILILTARHSIDDRVTGLEAGADDYLAKPFAFRELIARIKALSRRHLVDRSAILRCGPLELDTSARRLAVNGKQLALTAKEMAIMEFFLRHQGQVLSREQILDNVWSYDLTNDRNLVEVYMGRLRKKLKGAGIDEPFVTTRGLGYRLTAPDE